MAEAAVPESELWIVNISAGQTRTMTLEEVDDAFNSGLINEGTMVCEVGTDLWQPLYVVAGLEPPRPTTPGSPAPPAQSSVPDVHPLPLPATTARVNPTPLSSNASATPDFLAPRTGFGASSSPPAGAPSPPGAGQSIPRPGSSGPSRLPSAQTPPLPADYMSHARTNSARPGSTAGTKNAPAAAKGSSNDLKGRTAAPPAVAAAPKASLKATLPGTTVPFVPNESAARTAAPAATAPKMSSTLQGPFPVLSPAAPSVPPAAAAATTAASAAPLAASMASQPPASMRSKAPPLPPNAFSHLAAEALAEVGATEPRSPAAPAAFTSGPPPLPASAFQNSGFPPANVTPAQSPGPANGAAWAETVAPAVYAPAAAAYSPAAAQPATQGFGAQSLGAQGLGMPLPAQAAPTGRSRGEVWTIALAAVLGLLITLHRNSVIHGLSGPLGFKTGYESFEKAVFGEPSIDTPRGIQSLLQRTEKAREKSAATPDHQ